MAATISHDSARHLEPTDGAASLANRPKSIGGGTEFAAPAVLISIDDEPLRNRCLSALQASDVRLWSDGPAAPEDQTIEVMVVAGQHGPTSQVVAGQSPPGHSRPAIISIGAAHAEAEVCLPVDFLPRELLTACRLLTSIVRLRGDLAKGRLAERQLEREAHLDPLTQLPNRRAWTEELATRLSRAHNTHQPLGLAIVDVDHFKQINDGWGHAAGDQLLVAAAMALRQGLRQEDFVARLGGDEFGLLLSGLDAEGVQSVLQRVHAELPARIASRSRQVASVTIGYAVDHGSAPRSAEELTRAADSAWQTAKQRGRNQIVAAD